MAGAGARRMFVHAVTDVADPTYSHTVIRSVEPVAADTPRELAAFMRALDALEGYRQVHLTARSETDFVRELLDAAGGEAAREGGEPAEKRRRVPPAVEFAGRLSEQLAEAPRVPDDEVHLRTLIATCYEMQ